MTARVVIVTGAASGIGLAIVSRLLSLGDCVVAFDLSEISLLACENERWADHRDALLTVAGDVSEEAQVGQLVGIALDRFGRVDAIVNNAGITGSQTASVVHETPIAEFDRIMAVNVRGVFLGCQAVLPHMLGRSRGIIVNIASVASLVAFPARAAYTASKGAVLQLTRAIAADYAPAGIRCNALCPGIVETPMTRWRLNQPELRTKVLERIPQREIGTPADIAAAVEFLVSDNARYMNGAAVVIDGGYAAI